MTPSRPFASATSRRQAVIAVLTTLFVASAILALGGGRLHDEWVHYAQVERFVAGRFELVDELTTIPGYHALVALIEKAAGGPSFPLARGVTMAFAIAATLTFASIRRKLFPDEDALVPTAQFTFCPIYFPFCFLLYTDVPSLALVLGALRLALARRHRWAGLVGIASLLVRQNNVVWIGYIAFVALIDACQACTTWPQRWRSALSLWPYALGMACFFVYWAANGSVSMSRSVAHWHPDLAFHTGNLFFLLFLAGVLFLPLLPVWLARYVRAVRSRHTFLLLPFVLALLYAATFKVDHPFNAILPHVFLRNGVLQYIVHHIYAYIAFGAVAVIAGCALSQVRWQRPAFMLVLPLSAVFVSASWLIEQRYYLIPFALLMATRAAEAPWAERVMLACWVPTAMVLVSMLSATFFL